MERCRAGGDEALSLKRFEIHPPNGKIAVSRTNTDTETRMSDNWNILAKILGTPGPPEDTSQKASDESKQDPSGKSDEDTSASHELPPVAEAAAEFDDSPEEDASPTSEEVLDALTSAGKTTTLPGFGSLEPDPAIEELAAGGPEAVEEPVVEVLLERE